MIINLNIIKQVLNYYTAIIISYDKLNDLLGFDSESVFYQQFFLIIDDYITNSAKLAGDTDDLLNWYIFDNNLGNSALNASHFLPNEDRCIKTEKDFLWLLEKYYENTK